MKIIMPCNNYTNNKDNNDPWKDTSNNSKKNKSIIDSELPDIYNIFIKKIKFNIKKYNFNKFNKINFHFGLFLIILLFVWIGSGFYIIKEEDRGIALRFGKFHHLVQPGLNWKPTFVDTIKIVNVGSVRELATSGIMLTSDENVVHVEMNVQYRVINPERYLFSTTNADESLRQATDSALRGVIGKYSMDRILTEGRTLVRSDTKNIIEDIIYPYNMGIIILDVNFQTARPPEEVKSSFDDAIAARENEQQYIREAEAYANEVKPKANGQAQRILEESKSYKESTVLEAQGEIKRFNKLLHAYESAPEITRSRIYINTMEHILSNTNKILINKELSDLMFFPLNKKLYTVYNSKNYDLDHKLNDKLELLNKTKFNNKFSIKD